MNVYLTKLSIDTIVYTGVSTSYITMVEMQAYLSSVSHLIYCKSQLVKKSMCVRAGLRMSRGLVALLKPIFPLTEKYNHRSNYLRHLTIVLTHWLTGTVKS